MLNVLLSSVNGVKLSWMRDFLWIWQWWFCVCVCVRAWKDTHAHRSLHSRRSLGSTGTFSGTWSSLLYDTLSDSWPCTQTESGVRHSVKEMLLDTYTQCWWFCANFITWHKMLSEKWIVHIWNQLSFNLLSLSCEAKTSLLLITITHNYIKAFNTQYL